ncbi:hypothetical protein [Fictibacillus solisalsi]|uniref:hypothetical protein n=1 Tax=Fictibacillus solisalsi TaxID=459525 RepID=UPI0011136B13|nr:hypothetical protein [Fictibacillus solisalsi]
MRDSSKTNITISSCDVSLPKRSLSHGISGSGETRQAFTPVKASSLERKLTTFKDSIDYTKSSFFLITAEKESMPAKKK